jgi:WD40-like Beta Propeller Repeat
MQDRTLMAQRVDTDSLQLSGVPVAVADDVVVDIYNSRPAFSVSDSGVLTYFAGSTFSKRPIVWMDRKGKDPVTAAPDAAYWNLALAPGAEHMAVSRWETGGATGQANLDVYLWEFSRKVETRLTFGPARDGVPVWSPDGKELAFSSARERDIAQIYRRVAAGGDIHDERLTEGPPYKIADDWSGDGNYIIYSAGGDVMAIPLRGDKKPIAIVQTPAEEREGAISPDGRARRRS